MLKRRLLAAAMTAACFPASANSDLDAIRAEIDRMKQDYEARIAALEARLKAAETRASTPVPPVKEADTRAATSVPADTAKGGAGRFNPEIGLILQGRYAWRKDLDERDITGFETIGEDEHAGERGFSLDHSELVLSASVDPFWRGFATFALADEEVEVEEAWFQSQALGNGLSLKGGRFFSGLGYLNEQHPHAWDFADAPLMYQAVFGERYYNDGLQIAWLAPLETFLKLGFEAGRGGPIVGQFDGNGAGSWTAFAKLGGDVGTSHSWRAGLAYLSAKPQERSGHWEDDNDVETETLFSGTSETWVADFVWKWAPAGNARERNFKFQTELFHRTESGDLSCADNTANGGLCTGNADRFDTRQSGWYAQGVYQFMPRWRTGLRYDRLDSGSQSLGTGFAGVLSTTDYKPSKYSLMVDFSPSEFSRFRVQYARDRSMQGMAENQWTAQYIMSLGAHGAHAF